MTMKNVQLCRSTTDRMLAGVCGGLAAYFGIDASWIRLIFIIIILFGGSGIFVYLILWVLLPEADTKQIKGGDMTASKRIWGLSLIVLGLVMLLQNFGLADYLYLDKTWPAILVILGVYVLSK